MEAYSVQRTIVSRSPNPLIIHHGGEAQNSANVLCYFDANRELGYNVLQAHWDALSLPYLTDLTMLKRSRRADCAVW